MYSQAGTGQGRLVRIAAMSYSHNGAIQTSVRRRLPCTRISL